MTILHLIRHGHHDLLGRELVGRRPGVRLSAAGQRQAAAVGAALSGTRVAAVMSSPQERTLQTAAPIAQCQGLEVEVAQGLDEVDFGAWTGRSFDELQRDPAWQRFNATRSRMAVPGGEGMVDIQARIVRLLEDLAGRFPDGALALVSHGDVIRAGLLHYLGMPLDFVHRLHIAPASISTIAINDRDCRVLAINVEIDRWPWGGNRP